MKTQQKWYRIDKANGQVAMTGGVNVFRAASGNYDRPQEVIEAGRFQTPLAIYSRGDLMTDEDWRSAEAPSGINL